MLYRLKTPQALDVGVRAMRGLSLDTPLIAMTMPAIELLPAIFELAQPLVESSELALEVGVEKPLRLTLPDIPGDANITRIVAAVVTPAADSTPPTTLSQQSTVKEGNSTTTYTVDIKAPAGASGITVKLAGGDVFFTLGQVAPSSRYDMPEEDLVREVNAFLEREGSAALEFVVQGSGRIKIAVYRIDYTRLKTASWVNELDNTVRVDRNLELAFASQVELDLEPLAGAGDLVLSEVALDIGGELGPERLLGSAPQHTGQSFATISRDYALGQSLLLPSAVESIQCTGVSICVQVEAKAEVYIAIRSDASGAPGGDPPLAQTNLVVEPPPDQALAARWVYAAFGQPVELRREIVYWAVVMGIEGRALLAVQTQPDTYLGETRVHRGGAMWKPFFAAERPLLRLVYHPAVDTQSAGVVLRLSGTAVQQPFDPTPDPQNLRLVIPNGTASAVRLVVESNARGSLSLANIIQTYVPR